jgi:hypothetical protein
MFKWGKTGADYLGVDASLKMHQNALRDINPADVS